MSRGQWSVWAHVAADMEMALDGTLTRLCVTYGYHAEGCAKREAEALRDLQE